MNKSKRQLGVCLVALVLSTSTFAQFGNLLGGGSKESGGDPTKIEQNLKSIIETTSIAMGKFADALGMKEEAAKFSGNAECIKAGSCGLSDSINVIETVGPSVLAEAETKKASGQKLDATASAAATQALLPALTAFPLWKQVVDGVKGLDKSAAFKFAGLIQAAPKVPAAVKGTIDVLNGGISYLSFSGADTAELKDAAAKTLKF